MADILSVGLQGRCTLLVSEEHTAAHWGSGSLRVLATPQMIALMEQAAATSVESYLPEGCQTVGTLMQVRHIAATPVGGHVTVTTELIRIDDRVLTFHVQAHDEAGLIGEGEHQRYIINAERFMERALKRRSAS